MDRAHSAVTEFLSEYGREQAWIRANLNFSRIGKMQDSGEAQTLVIVAHPQIITWPVAWFSVWTVMPSAPLARLVDQLAAAAVEMPGDDRSL